jgi:hypothetical protein
VGTVGMARVDGEGRSAQATGCGTSAPVDHKQAVATMSTPREQRPRAHLASSRSFRLSSDDHERATVTTSELQPKRKVGNRAQRRFFPHLFAKMVTDTQFTESTRDTIVLGLIWTTNTHFTVWVVKFGPVRWRQP